MTPHDPDQESAGTPDEVPLDPDWPDIDAARHKVRVDYTVLQHAGNWLTAQAPEYQSGAGGSDAVDAARSLGPAWGGWEAAAPLQAAAEQAMEHIAEVYQRLLKDYEAAGHLLLQTAQNYADADITTHLAAVLEGRQQSPGGW
jgi:hypothetical protein